MEGKFVDVGRRVQKKNDFKHQSLFFRLFKRIVDILGSACGLILLSPVFLVVAFLIRLEDPSGPVVFSQKRVGKQGRLFTMYKFRSMCVDAEEQLHDLIELNEIEGAMFKIKEDPRVTKIGKKIRKTSIDELPQLLNVLKGEMSLVGPRPPLQREVDEYSQRDMQRLSVKPGCTGLWQIRGRNDVHFDDMVDFDLEYIEQQSIYNDFKIILLTFKVMFLSRGAY
ncbi:UDP-phosphate galactose phosphotransferase [Enterococcus plantarum]|uniref:Sugar transferase n=1 Tax=Enterococcus plantarum TaxID=1077675 RepID=A0A2W4BVF3_9ENTE|nr:sugar transferase [Enterococcus plantarum]MBO0424144.1 sugar transferase [Enterococcus plantarum]MBO0467086.1 sugar transferase [Enterococcus plantarum]OEG18261.1 UDP-phosphate galactose phosphotransferase [Enterococcus plantarum]PZL77902.1 sugar transferase [Enterococcus plantarum]